MVEDTNTTDATLDDLRDNPVSVGFRVTNNNEKVDLYPDAPGAELGVIKHKYEGFPAQGVVLYDVTGWEIADYDLDLKDEDVTMEEEFEMFEDEIREWIADVLFNTSLSSADANTYHGGTHTIVVEDPSEGDRYTVELKTENKRRVR